MSTASIAAPGPGQPVRTPPDFPVVWADPRDAGQTWLFDPVHFPDPMMPLTFAVAAAFMRGGIAGFAQAGLPFKHRVALFNTYVYNCIEPTAAPPAGVANAILERFEAHWLDELLPEIKQHLAYCESCDLCGLSLEQLRAHLAETLRRVERMGVLHFLALLPSLYAMSQFEELYCELFAGATTLEALRLTQGFENQTMAGDRALWRVSREALATPAVRAILSEHAPGEVIPALEQTAAAQGFLADFRAWLGQYGQRLNSVFALAQLSWIEDPTPAIGYLQADLARAEPWPGMDPIPLAAEREQAVAEARAKLAGYPQPVVARFEMLLKAAQLATVINEDHNVWIDQRLFYHVRRVIVEFGQRLAQAGTFDAVNDVFCLQPEELLAGPDSAVKSLVQARQAEIERFRHVTPPPMLGTAPALEMPDSGPSPILRALLKGEMGSGGHNQAEAHRVTGVAGSAGVARGPARLIHSLAEAGRLQPGEVLVAAATAPPWTPLFATAAAVVTDIGGVLSHSAVVAREYRIPAVVGTGGATTTFSDGQLLEVDGNTGVVRLVIEEAEHEPALTG